MKSSCTCVGRYNASCFSFTMSSSNSIFYLASRKDINKGKRQITNSTNSRAFFKRKWFQKTIFERRTCTFRSVCSDEITVLHCKNVLSWNWRIYTYNSSFNFCGFFLWKMLLARAQYLLSGAELDDGLLTEINFDSTGKRMLYNIQPQIFWLYNVIGLNVTYSNGLWPKMSC